MQSCSGSHHYTLLLQAYCISVRNDYISRSMLLLLHTNVNQWKKLDSSLRSTRVPNTLTNGWGQVLGVILQGAFYEVQELPSRALLDGASTFTRTIRREILVVITISITVSIKSRRQIPAFILLESEPLVLKAEIRAFTIKPTRKAPAAVETESPRFVESALLADRPTCSIATSSIAEMITFVLTQQRCIDSSLDRTGVDRCIMTVS